MSVLNIGAQVLTTYKADVKPHKRALKELTGAQKKQAKAALDALEKQNAGKEKQIALLGKVGVAIGAVTAAVMAGRAAWKEYARDQQLQGAAAGRSIESLRKATHGLMTQEQLLLIAQTANTSQFKLTNEQMLLMSEYMLVLRKKGEDMGEVFKEVRKAVTEANAEGLKRFGDGVRATTGTVEGFNAIMGMMRQRVNEMGGDYAIAGDDMKRTSVEMSDKFRQLKISIGELVNDLQPLLSMLLDIASAAAKAARAVASVVSKIKVEGPTELQERSFHESELGIILSHNLQLARFIRRQQRQKERAWRAKQRAKQAVAAEKEADYTAHLAQASVRAGALRGAYDVGDIGGYYDARTGKWVKGKKPPARRRGGGRGSGDRYAIRNAGQAVREMMAGQRGYSSVTGGDIGDVGLGIGGQTFATPSAYLAAPDLTGQLMPGMDEHLRGVIDKQRGIAIQSNEGFQMLQQGATAAFQAVITGSGSMAQAFRKAVGSMMAAKATQMFGEAITQGVWALASLAASDPKSAAMHGKAAASAIAGAAALGAMARALGYSGASPGGSVRAGVGGGRGIAGASTSRTVIIMGDDFGTDSRRRRQARLRAALKAAEQNEGSEETVSFN